MEFFILFFFCDNYLYNIRYLIVKYILYFVLSLSCRNDYLFCIGSVLMFIFLFIVGWFGL